MTIFLYNSTNGILSYLCSGSVESLAITDDEDLSVEHDFLRTFYRRDCSFYI